MIDPLEVPCPLCGNFPEYTDETKLTLKHQCDPTMFSKESWIDKGINGAMGYLLRDRIIFSWDIDEESGKKWWWMDTFKNGKAFLTDKSLEEWVMIIYDKVIKYRSEEAKLQEGSGDEV